MTAPRIAGGIVSDIYSGDGSIENCYNAGSVISEGIHAGGILGTVDDCDMGNNISILNCYNVGSVNCPTFSAGAIYGGAYGEVSLMKATVTITNVYSLENMLKDSSGDGNKLCGDWINVTPGEPGDATFAVKTAADMRSPEFAAALGAGFQTVSGGFPKLAWEIQ